MYYQINKYTLHSCRKIIYLNCQAFLRTALQEENLFGAVAPSCGRGVENKASHHIYSVQSPPLLFTNNKHFLLLLSENVAIGSTLDLILFCYF